MLQTSSLGEQAPKHTVPGNRHLAWVAKPVCVARQRLLEIVPHCNTPLKPNQCLQCMPGGQPGVHANCRVCLQGCRLACSNAVLCYAVLSAAGMAVLWSGQTLQHRLTGTSTRSSP